MDRLDRAVVRQLLCRIAADRALPLPRYIGTSERLWMNLQMRHDPKARRSVSRAGWFAKCPCWRKRA